ncbi:MAG: lipoyl(octanoyl) transferase [Pelagibacterales bacterium]|nr:lipoyl(octanoyl) transferase [Pelagibacterales bacterium]
MDIEIKISKKPIDYIDSMNILEKRVLDIIDGKKKELLWLLEHTSVYTSGTSSNDKDLLNKKIKVIKTNRGGKHTYHGPGQKIVYFVLNLNNREKDIRKLIDKIEKCIIDVLKEYNIKSYPDKKNIGIWIDNKNKSEKISAIGIRVKKWIAYHGFAINVSNDLSKYKEIVPCGISDKGVTSFKKLKIINYNNINNIIIKKFLDIFL